MKTGFMFLFCAAMLAQTGGPRFADLLRNFEYDPRVPFDVRESSVQDRGGVKVHDLSYVGGRGNRVPAYLVTPPGKGRFAAILFGHWMLPGSPLKNRGEFLDEAVLLARSGAICLLTDSPLVRPGFVEDTDPLSPQRGYAAVEQAVDFRRGIDMLLARGDVDPARIAYVGHSFDAKVGALLAGVEKRISSFVLMAGGYAEQDYVFRVTTPEVQNLRKQAGDEKIREYFEKYPWDDPVNYIGHTAPAVVFLQYGKKDAWIPEAVAHHDAALFSGSNKVAFYDSGHELNSAARRDRVAWLVERLKLSPVDPRALARIPQLR